MLKKKKRMLKGTGERLRLSVFRSNKNLYAQIIDDQKGKTILGLSEQKINESKSKEKLTRMEKARILGQTLAQRAKIKKVTKVVFDKGSYAYHGRIKALADGAREGGLEF